MYMYDFLPTDGRQVQLSLRQWASPLQLTIMFEMNQIQFESWKLHVRIH